MAVMTEEQEQYLRDHDLGILGTGRRDGSPQLSMVTYVYEGARLLISVTRDRAKYPNIMRNPHVALLVPDGRQQLIVYGSAEVFDGPERDEIIKLIRIRMGDPLPPGTDPARFSQRLDELKRVAVRITPEKVLGGPA